MKRAVASPSPGRKAPQARVLSQSACYIYGIVGNGKRIVLEARAISSPWSKVYTLPYKDIAAILSRSDYVQYDPSEENLLIHNKALQEIRATYKWSVLPLRFSTVAKSEDDVLKILANGYYKFRSKLNYLRDKLEIAVDVLCDVDALRKSAASKVAECGTDGGGGASSEKYEQDVQEIMRKESYAMASALLEKLKSLSVEHRLGDLVFDDMTMNGAFLIEETKLAPFLAEVRSHEKRFAGLYRIELSGPYVPYSFTEPEEI